MKKLTLSLITLLSINAYAGGDITPPVVDVIVPDVVVPVTNTVDYALALKVGTLGMGLDLSIPINNKFNVRVNLNGASYSDDTTESGIKYEYDLDLLTAGVLVDYYPMENSQFRVTGGVYYNGNELEMCGKPDVAGITVGNITYTANQVGSLNAKVEFDDVAPYIGIGWGNTVKKGGWSFNADVGIMYQGEPDVTLTPIYGPLITNAGLQAPIDAQVKIEEAQLQDELDDYKIYPVISVGVTYTF